MKRRLYFLFPDPVHARHAVDTLADGTGVDARHIHAIAQREGRIARLPRPTAQQQSDLAGRLESWLWNGNLLLFGLALLAFIAALVEGAAAWAVAALLVMALTFLGGFLFTTYVPHVHLNEFRAALAHGEILLMIDVPTDKVKMVEDYILHHYPEAVAGGTSWSVEAFGL